MAIYHVAKNGSDQNRGSEAEPFLTINAAARIAVEGDTVTVHGGEYREWVKPQNAGLSSLRCITYQAAEGERVVIKGSERIDSWTAVQGNVWKVSLPNTFFGSFNPYSELVTGDWLMYNKDARTHLGDVYLNGISFYEVTTYDELLDPQPRQEIMDNWTKDIVPVHNPEQTKYVWYADVDYENTTIYANFQGADPNEELVEINVRKCCFYPEKVGVNYITVRGFEMAQAASPWTPPTADQPGLLGAHWSKGWVIENNVIHDAKCSAISIGKEASTGNNYCTVRKDKPGYQYQLESVFTAGKAGWSKEKIGGHTIRNNTIYDCGQNGIVGHLGCVFSEIYGNHIYNIALKREYYGHEIAGIKLHAAIDVQIHNNRIHDCSLGIWLDWQTQGTQISKNLLYRNNRDLFVEVSHGPYLVEHNIFASSHALTNAAQGGAYVNNIFAGDIAQFKVLNRATPYHTPHSTDVAGYAMVYGGDDRFIQNIFIGNGKTGSSGTANYNGYTTSLLEYIDTVQEDMPGDLNLFEKTEQPVMIVKNAYFNGASPFDRDEEKLVMQTDIGLRIEEREDGVYLSCNMPEAFTALRGGICTSACLGRVRIVDADYENPDGSHIALKQDYLGECKEEQAVAGPLQQLTQGENCVKVWGC